MNKASRCFLLSGIVLLVGCGLTALPPLAIAQSPAPKVAPLSGQEVVDLVKRLLAGFGVRGRLKLQLLNSSAIAPAADPAIWGLVVTDAQGQRYQTYIASDQGRITLYRGSEQEAFQRGGTPHPASDPQTEQKVRLWLAKTGTHEPTRLASLTVDEKGVGKAYFPILRNGYPFISHSHYGYEFTFDAATRKFMSLTALQNPPPVVPGPPRLDKTAALAALKRIWETRVVPETIKTQHARRVWYDLKGEPELGYYLPKGKKEAGLTWLIHFWNHVETEFGSHGGDNGMLIDAMTGEQIPSNVVP